MSELEAVLVGGLLAGGFTVATLLVTGARETAAAERAVAGERQPRIRVARLRALEDTRTFLIGQLDWLEAFAVVRNLEPVEPDHAAGRRANLALIGDVGVAREYSERVAELLEQLPMNWWQSIRHLRPRTLSEIPIADMTRTAEVRSHVLAALDRQEERVLRDEEALVLTDAELESLPGAKAFAELVRRRTGRA